MAFDLGIDFRNSLAFVTDPSGCIWSDQSPNDSPFPHYPISSGGTNIGWEGTVTGIGCRDRNAGIDARFAGMHFMDTNVGTYRVDLPNTGTYDIRLAMGDANYARSSMYWVLKDDTTAFSTFSNVATTSGNRWLDATGVERTSDTDWANNNAKITRTFTSTILRIQLGNASSTDISPIAHIRITEVPTVGGGPNYVPMGRQVYRL